MADTLTLFGANLSFLATQSMPVSMTVARKLRDLILGDQPRANFPTAVLLVFVALWKIEAACTSVIRVLLKPFKRTDPREEVLHFQRATGMGDNLAFAAIDLYIAQKLGYKKLLTMSKASWQRLRPAGSPETVLSTTACLRLPQALASLCQAAARAALAGHTDTGVGFEQAARRLARL